MSFRSTLVLRGVLKRPDGCILMMRRASVCKSWPGLWEFPGGKIDPGEDPFDAVVREFKEETALTVYPQKIICGFDWSWDDRRIIYLVFHVRASLFDVIISAEHDDHRWVRPEQLSTLQISPPLLKLAGDRNALDQLEC